MTGLELAREYYENCGRQMMEREFPGLLDLIAVGFTGPGSDRYGYDDDISRDHDFEPGFQIFLPGEDVVSRRDAFLLERAYAKLPMEYMGIRRQRMSPVGGSRNGVIRTADYYLSAVGTPDGALTPEAWLRIPDSALAEAVNGQIFYDGYGEVTNIRGSLSRMPEDILKKRVAGSVIIMAQAGQYNYSRCLRRGEKEASQLAAHDFTVAAMRALFLLRGRYMPYYKWSFRALRELSLPEGMADRLSYLITGDISDTSGKQRVIEEVSADMITELKLTGLSSAESADLEAHAYSVNDGIYDGNIRNLNIFAAV